MTRRKSTSRFFSILVAAMLAFVLLSPAKSYSFSSPGDTAQYKGWTFGLNLGAFFANKYTANFYSGLPSNENSIGLIFNNQYHINDIERALNDTFRLGELPADMRYDPSFSAGFYIKNNLGSGFGGFIQFNYAKLKTHDVFTLYMGPEPGYLTFEEIRTYPVWGVEQRVQIDIGVVKDFPLSKHFSLFAEGGFNLNNVSVRENGIAIENLEYSLINVYGSSSYVPNSNMQTFTVRQGGIGFGGFAGGGFRLKFNENITLDPGLTMYWSKTKLTGYDGFKPHFYAFVRLCYENLITSDKND